MIFIERATPGTLTEFKDLLAKQLLEVKETWSLDYRTYRSQVRDSEDRNTLLYSLTFSHHDRRTVLMRGGSGLVLGGTTDNNNTTVPPQLQTCSTGYSEPVDQLLNSKLSNMWTQRQVVRGDAGESLLVTGDVMVRIVNLFSSTGFKGLLIEVDGGSVDTVLGLLKEMNVVDYKVAQEDNTSDNDATYKLAELYIKVLE